jgi:hypothetical protein
LRKEHSAFANNSSVQQPAASLLYQLATGIIVLARRPVATQAQAHGAASCYFLDSDIKK